MYRIEGLGRDLLWGQYAVYYHGNLHMRTHECMVEFNALYTLWTINSMSITPKENFSKR